MFENRKYVIINTSDIDKVDFTEVHETSAETCRYSVDRTKTFVKYDGEMPESIQGLGTENTHSEILDILSTNEWTAPIDEEI